MSTDTSSSSYMSTAVADQQRTLTVVGIVLAALGVLAILFPYVTGVSLSILLGILLVVGALLHVAAAFSAPGWTGSLIQVGLGLLYAVAGIGLLANPVLGLTTLTLLLVAYFFIEGVTLIVMGFIMRQEQSWFWSAVSGVISILLAAMLFAGFPSTAAWAVGLLFGIHLLSTGIGLVLVGRRTETPMMEAGRPTA